MIMSRTPFRISLFGGGTDYPAWYRQHGGAVIGTTINKYCYISFRSLPPFFEHRHRIVYSRIELPQHIDEIQHPAVRCVLRDYGVDEGVEVQHYGDLPARSGMAAGLAAWLGLAYKLRRWLPVNPDQCCSQEITLRVHRGRGDVESPRDRPAITLVERPHNQTRYEHRAT